eukprot:CAMPEP_0172783038 /NCGR_PEP_ID=MMETSP1074-20121228/204235_1 /TAXON_ID=2916 /ORGANISM="Ceratium fusus, Strain PA161109" /LENGTH=113 /DNA_ID=CAMNT_0013620025 /DNA_START=420 /DNA_END=762 /DNA_ORIENTATION=-
MRTGGSSGGGGTDCGAAAGAPAAALPSQLGIAAGIAAAAAALGEFRRWPQMAVPTTRPQRTAMGSQTRGDGVPRSQQQCSVAVASELCLYCSGVQNSPQTCSATVLPLLLDHL